MYGKSEEMEIREAIAEGRKTLHYLENAQEYLSSAKNWGIWDMLGGGFLTGMMKHSRIDAAREAMEDARREMLNFQRELKDVQVPLEFRVDIDGFLTFADFFFDGIVADWLVQSKINEAREQVEDAISMVTGIVEDLEHMKAQLGAEVQDGMFR